METFVTLLIPALLGVIVLRLMVMPLQWFFKMALHAFSGFLCLWLLNAVSGFTGLFFPINTVTVAIAGFLGIPGIGLLALLELMA